MRALMPGRFAPGPLDDELHDAGFVTCSSVFFYRADRALD